MAEYIEREDAMKIVTDIMCDCKVTHKGRAIRRNIKQLPAADVVEVVSCKDCLYKNEWANDGSYPDYNFCKHSGLWHLTDNHFCSYGEKKEGAEK